MSDNTSKEECPWHVSMTHACLVARGVIEGSKEKEMLELSHTDYYQTIKSNPWSSYLHLCVVSTCSPPLDIWWCLQISPTSSIFGKEVRAWRKYLEIVSTADRTINRYFFLVCQVGRISQTAIAYICSFAVPQLRWWIALVMEQNIYILANNLTYPWRIIVYWSKKKDSCCWLMLFCTQ